MTDLTEWLEKVERKLRGSGARANISLHDSSLLCARLRAAMKVVEAAQCLSDEYGYQQDIDCDCAVHKMIRAIAAFNALSEEKNT